MKKIEKYLEGNWDELKGKIKQKWSKLTDDDLLQIEGSYNALSGKLEKLYADKISNVEEEITAFLSKNGFKEATNAVAAEVDSIKNAIFEYMDQYYKNLKENSNYIEEKTAKSLKENPMKWLGAAVLGGFLLAKLF